MESPRVTTDQWLATTPTSQRSTTSSLASIDWVYTANLTLGNKKGADIVVVRDTGDVVTVEVKGLAKKYDWPFGNLETKHPDQHFIALVSFEGRIDEANMPPPRV